MTINPSDVSTEKREGEFLTSNDVRDLLRQRCKDAGGRNKWAMANGPSEQYVCDVLAGRREPGPAIYVPLGLKSRRIWEFLKKGLDAENKNE